ncbi:MAG: hypothetical protein NTU73_08455, partial [Ignavibacteriae bacterium]|nr:hypothetical protein [Ignavibacteriota bacterium]
MENNENIEQKNLDIDDIPITEPSDLTANQFQEEIENFEKIKDKAFDIYKIIIDTRKFEIENFWKRTTFFWGALAIIAVGYFNA